MHKKYLVNQSIKLEKYFTDEVLTKIDEYTNKNSPTDKTKNKLYTFVQREDDFSCIKILDEYNGIIYKYGNVKFAQTENANVSCH